MFCFKWILVVVLILHTAIAIKAQYVPLGLQQYYKAPNVAMSEVAAARAKTATDLDGVRWSAVDAFGRQMDKPLMIRYLGPLTNLYAATAPKRSFVGTINPGFYQEPSGKIKFRDETAIGALAV